jgi:hypothetical protein
LHYIKNLSPKQARTKDIARETGLRSTIFPILKQFEKDEILQVERGRQETVYKWTRNADNYLRKISLPEIRVTRTYYERLVRLVELDASYETFVKRLISAIGITLLPALLESIEKKQSIEIGIVLDDFKFFIMKYIANKRYPSSDERLDHGDIAAVTAFQQQKLDEQPELYEHQLKELQDALDTYRDQFLKEAASK